MRYNLVKNELVKTLLSDGRAEQSIFWIDEGTDILCKARADYINVEQGYIVDIKTTSNLADDSSFGFTLKQYHYDLSAGFYVDGFKKAIGRDVDFYFIVIESNPPHNYSIFKSSIDLLAQGRNKYKKALDTFTRANQSGNFAKPYNNGNLIELTA